MANITPEAQIELAKSHLQRVQTAAWSPVDWADLGNYGLYALEAAVMAAARKLGIDVKPSHWSKSDAATVLSVKHGLPDVSELMSKLNETRKSSNYGDVTAPELDAEEVSVEIEGFIEAAELLIDSHETEG